MHDRCGRIVCQLISDPDGIDNGSSVNRNIGNSDNAHVFGPSTHVG